jgi:hypothetical protein
MEKSLANITKWLKDSGLAVNKKKITKIPLNQNMRCFSLNLRCYECARNPIQLHWSQQVLKTVLKASKAINAIKTIISYFNTKELLQVLTSICYSIWYHNCEVCLLDKHNQNDKKARLTASSTELNMALHYPKHIISFQKLHTLTNRATPRMFCNYKLA